MHSQADLELLSYVNQVINSGATDISIPSSLITDASEQAMIEIQRLCKLNGVRINVVPG